MANDVAEVAMAAERVLLLAVREADTATTPAETVLSVATRELASLVRPACNDEHG